MARTWDASDQEIEAFRDADKKPPLASPYETSNDFVAQEDFSDEDH